MIGIVLCGGRSLRMGKDKGLLEWEGKKWAGLALEKIASFSIPCFLSVNATQVAEYENHFLREKLLVDSVNLPGPLAGLLTAHQKFPMDDIFIMACDMPGITLPLMDVLMNCYLAQSTPKNLVFTNNARLEPMLSIFTVDTLDKLEIHFSKSSLENFSMRNVLNMGGTNYIPLDHSWEVQFKNYNTPSDLMKTIN